MQAELDDFMNFCRVERRLAPATCRAYERDVRACRAFLEREGIHRWGAVRPPDLRRFLAAEAERRPAGVEPGAHDRRAEGLLPLPARERGDRADPARVLRTPKKSQALPDVLDQRELGRLLRAVERPGVWERQHAGKRERDRLLLAPFAYAGLRRSEPLGLDVDDLYLERRLLHVRHAKGGRQRVLPIHPALVPLFSGYLQARGPVACGRCSSACTAGGSRRPS